MKKHLLACMLVFLLLPFSTLAEIDYQPYNYDKAIASPSTYRDILVSVTGTVVASTNMADGSFAFFIDVDDVLNDTVLCILSDDLEQAEGIDIGCSVVVLGIASGDATEYGIPFSYPIINVIAVSNLGQLRADPSAHKSGQYIPYDYNEARHYSKYYRDTPVLLRGKVTDMDYADNAEGTTYKVQIPDNPLWYIFAYCDSNVSVSSVSVGDYIDIYGSASGLTSDLGLDYDVPVIKADSITRLGSKYPGGLEPENHIDRDGSSMTVYPGLYDVGKDIPSGTYIITAPDMRFSFARHGRNLRKDGDGYTVESDDTSDLICVYHENSSRYRSGERPTQTEYTLKDGYYFAAYHAPVILTPIAEAENEAESLAARYERCEKLSPDTKKAEMIPYVTYVVDLEDPTQYTWSSSNSDVVSIAEDGTFTSEGVGKATITGKPKDGSKKKIKISLTVNIPYVSSKNIVIDSPEGAELIACMGSGIIMTNYTGDDCFEVEKESNSSFVDRMRILPVKEGKGAIVYEVNFRKTVKVNITVKKSALMSEEERAELIEKAGENAQMATVKKGVNIRADATADSAKVGYAYAGEELIVTQAFYSPKWHQILYNDEICYVSAKYVDIGK